MTQTLPAELPAGTYATSYRVVSADGHPISGKVTFRVTTPSVALSSQAPASTASSVSPVTPATAAASDDDGDLGWVLLAGGPALAAVVAGVLVAGRRRNAKA